MSTPTRESYYAWELSWDELKALIPTKAAITTVTGDLICSGDRRCESKAELDTAFYAWVHDVQHAFTAGKQIPGPAWAAYSAWKGNQAIAPPTPAAKQEPVRPRVANGKLFAWSPSKLADFETCPYQFYHKHIALTVPFEETEEIKHGNRVHKALEKVAKGIELLDGEAKLVSVSRKYPDLFRSKGGKLMVEQQLAITRDLKPCGWFDAAAWGRCIMDVALGVNNHLLVADYKTGKLKDDVTQAEIMMIFAALHFKEYQTFQGKYIWLKVDQITGTPVLSRQEILPVFQGILRRVQRMEDAIIADVFVQRPSGLCRAYCPIKKCPHCGAK